MYGHLTMLQRVALLPFVEGRTVHDLGSGNHLEQSKVLLELGAFGVVAVDRSIDVDPCFIPQRVTLRRCEFKDFTDPVDVAFVSWPSSHPHDRYMNLVPILERARLVAYLGSNLNGIACGTPELFNHLMMRRMLAVVPDFRNSLLVCGEKLKALRAPSPEEAAAIEMYDADEPCARIFNEDEWAKYLSVNL